MSNLYQRAILLVFLFCGIANAQTQLTTDELFTKAREAAFENDNYPEAIHLSKMALSRSPDYLEISVFLGRLYTFTDSLDQARATFKDVLLKEIGHEDASLAYGNLEYWNKNSQAALDIVDVGLQSHPDSESLLILKVELLTDLKRYQDADIILENILKIYPKSTKARSLSERIKQVSAKNSIGINYDFVYFDKRFDDPWHLASIDYGRQTSIGSIIAKLNYANRFKTNALQFEIDAYPRISKLFYMYLNAGISDKQSIFPRYRAGASLYSNLPAAFELDAGFRYLKFDDDTFIYTFGIGKYYSNYWFNVRTYLTPSSNSVSQSYSLSVRYYFGGADDYFGLRLGTGISPDDNSNSVLFNPNNDYKLKSNNINIIYRTTLGKTNILFIDAALENQEYAKDTRGNQISLGLGYIKKF